jgi:hypothetical protein
VLCMDARMPRAQGCAGAAAPLAALVCVAVRKRTLQKMAGLWVFGIIALVPVRSNTLHSRVASVLSCGWHMADMVRAMSSMTTGREERVEAEQQNGKAGGTPHPR